MPHLQSDQDKCIFGYYVFVYYFCSGLEDWLENLNRSWWYLVVVVVTEIMVDLLCYSPSDLLAIRVEELLLAEEKI